MAGIPLDERKKVMKKHDSTFLSSLAQVKGSNYGSFLPLSFFPFIPPLRQVWRQEIKEKRESRYSNFYYVERFNEREILKKL